MTMTANEALEMIREARAIAKIGNRTKHVVKAGKFLGFGRGWQVVDMIKAGDEVLIRDIQPGFMTGAQIDLYCEASRNLPGAGIEALKSIRETINAAGNDVDRLAIIFRLVESWEGMERP